MECLVRARISAIRIGASSQIFQSLDAVVIPSTQTTVSVRGTCIRDRPSQESGQDEELFDKLQPRLGRSHSLTPLHALFMRMTTHATEHPVHAHPRRPTLGIKTRYVRSALVTSGIDRRRVPHTSGLRSLVYSDIGRYSNVALLTTRRQSGHRI